MIKERKRRLLEFKIRRDQEGTKLYFKSPTMAKAMQRYYRKGTGGEYRMYPITSNFGSLNLHKLDIELMTVKAVVSHQKTYLEYDQQICLWFLLDDRLAKGFWVSYNQPISSQKMKGYSNRLNQAVQELYEELFKDFIISHRIEVTYYDKS